MSPVDVMPVGDLIDHEMGDDCPCGPTVEVITPGDGQAADLLVVHHSLDGRERPAP